VAFKIPLKPRAWAMTPQGVVKRWRFRVLEAASRRLYRRGMSSFDYSAPAELFLSKPAKGSRTKYRRFATAAEALRYVVEDLRTPKDFGAHLEVGDERFDSSEIQRLYDAEDYPLRKPE
jgi:hypothetical protein